MKKLIVLWTLSTLFLTCACDNNKRQDDTLLDGYNLLWHDEFDGDVLDETYWNYMLGDGSSYGNPGWGNSEAQFYKKENVHLEEGNLIITAKKEKQGTNEYTSARISTANKVTTKYGRIEAKIALPAIEGLWPAFWMLPESDTPYGKWASSGEIDIMEARGRVNNMTSSALHYGSEGSSIYQTRTHTLKDSTIEDYHIYALEWEELKMSWYVDDDLFFTMDNHDDKRGPKWFSSANMDSLTAPFDWNFHILLNMAVGGHFDGFRLPPNDFSSAEMKVDYVRIYEFKEANDEN